MTHYDELKSALLADITLLNGVGDKLAEKLHSLIGGRSIRDLVLYRPTRWVDRSPVNALSDLIPGETQTARGVVQHISQAPRGSKLQKVRLADDTGFLTLVFFNSNFGYLAKQFPEGQSVAVSGPVEDFHGQKQISHPDYVVPAARIGEIPVVEPVYPLTAGITNKRLHSLILAGLARFPTLDDWLSKDLRSQHGWPSLNEALSAIHMPNGIDDSAFAIARSRLAYDEALARAVRFRQIRSATEANGSPPLIPPNKLNDAFESALPFAPTNAQKRANAEISTDLRRSSPMQRMLQGDVGAGKTTVAAYACFHAVKSGFQVAVMAPTEILARQLYSSIQELLAPHNLNIDCLTGGTRIAERREILAKSAAGEIDILCGTHALFQEKVEFSKLGLVIIDEQHRFGVNDRSKLVQKGQSPHLLIMSATPIPRSLAMTIHGDVDLSVLDEKPSGRKPVETRTLPDARIDDVIAAVGRAINRGEQVFWVCPRVEDEEGGMSAIVRHAMLDDIYEHRVGLVHGRLQPQEKTAALEDFRAGKTSVLVATTVIEVGVDVPGATIMVIEGAEKFGLAQLHQLRGRVGRGSKPSFCLLVYTPPLGETAKKRLDTLRKSEDGFHIAEVDFNLRGPGDILGLAQSGVPDFRFLDLSRDQGLLAMSQKDAAFRAGSADTQSLELEDLYLTLFSPLQDDKPKI